MKNRLLITECEPQVKEALPRRKVVLYKVHDNSTVFLLTHSSQVAEYVYEQLKLDYKKELEDVSKI
jgi:hypothetical protein